MVKIIKRPEVDSTPYALYERTPFEAALLNASQLEEGPAALLARAQQEAERRLQEAYAEGLRRGAEEGKREYLESVAASAQALRTLAEQMQEVRSKFCELLEEKMLALTRAITSRILLREAQADPEAVRRVLQRVLEVLTERERLVVRMNPRDCEALNREASSFLEALDAIKQKEIIPDESVAPGGCIVETATLHVDAQLDAQLERVLEELSEVSCEPPAAP